MDIKYIHFRMGNRFFFQNKSFHTNNPLRTRNGIVTSMILGIFVVVMTSDFSFTIELVRIMRTWTLNHGQCQTLVSGMACCYYVLCCFGVKWSQILIMNWESIPTDVCQSEISSYFICLFIATGLCFLCETGDLKF